MLIQDNHFLVTGGVSGLGYATVKRLISDGGKVTIFDRNDILGKQVVDEFKSDNILFIKVDILSEEEIINGIEKGISKFGELKGIIHCAGILIQGKIIPDDGSKPNLLEYSKVININLIGSINILCLGSYYMKNNKILENNTPERGVIILVSSVAGMDGPPGITFYNASKGGIIAMTLSSARELATYGIRVNTIAPGIFKTPMVTVGLSEEAQGSFIKDVQFPKRMGNPEEFADLANSLITNQYFNSTVVRLDGGLRCSAL